MAELDDSTFLGVAGSLVLEVLLSVLAFALLAPVSLVVAGVDELSVPLSLAEGETSFFSVAEGAGAL